VVAGDHLMRIDGAPIPEGHWDVTAKVRGPPGTMVELGFDREDGGQLDVSLRRERIPNPW
jgi:C-terminal processing protease CtpA/Prc